MPNGVKRSAEGESHPSALICRREDTPAGITILHLEGEIDGRTAPALERDLTMAVRRGGHVIVDMQHVRYVDASAYRLLARLQEGRPAPHQRLVLAGLTPAVRQTAGVLGLRRVVDIAASVDDAKRRLKIR